MVIWFVPLIFCEQTGTEQDQPHYSDATPTLRMSYGQAKGSITKKYSVLCSFLQENM